MKAPWRARAEVRVPGHAAPVTCDTVERAQLMADLYVANGHRAEVVEVPSPLRMRALDAVDRALVALFDVRRRIAPPDPLDELF